MVNSFKLAIISRIVDDLKDNVPENATKQEVINYLNAYNVTRLPKLRVTTCTFEADCGSQEERKI